MEEKKKRKKNKLERKRERERTKLAFTKLKVFRRYLAYSDVFLFPLGRRMLPADLIRRRHRWFPHVGKSSHR